MGQDGVNWAKQLSLYHRILNNDPQGVIAYKTPFEIYFARLRLNLPSAYSIGEKNYIRFRGKPSNKRHVTEGCIVKRKVKLHTYRVSYTSPLSGKEEWKWVSVDDVTSLTLEREKQK